MKRFQIGLAFSVAASVIGVSVAPASAIVFGNPLDANPWGPNSFSYLQEMNGIAGDEFGVFNYTCSGALLNPTTYLTAQHCIGAEMSVAGISATLFSSGTRDPFNSAVGDWAVLQLSSELQINGPFAQIASSFPSLIPSGNAVIAGFGYNTNWEYTGNAEWAYFGGDLFSTNWETNGNVGGVAENASWWETPANGPTLAYGGFWNPAEGGNTHYGDSGSAMGYFDSNNIFNVLGVTSGGYFDPTEPFGWSDFASVQTVRLPEQKSIPEPSVVIALFLTGSVFVTTRKKSHG